MKARIARSQAAVVAAHKIVVNEMLGKPDGELEQVFEGAVDNAHKGFPDIPWTRRRKDSIYYRINFQYVFGCTPTEFSKKVGCTRQMAFFFQSGHRRFGKVIRNYVAALFNISPTTLKLITDHVKHERWLAESGQDDPCIIPDYLMHYFEPYVYKPSPRTWSMKWQEGRKKAHVQNITWMIQKAANVPFENRLAFVQALETSYLYKQYVKSGGEVPTLETNPAPAELD